MNNPNRYEEDPKANVNAIQPISPDTAKKMNDMDNKYRAKYYNILRRDSDINIGGRTIKNKKKHKRSLRRSGSYSKKNKRQMKRK
jgi:hypothetical protein